MSNEENQFWSSGPQAAPGTFTELLYSDLDYMPAPKEPPNTYGNFNYHGEGHLDGQNGVNIMFEAAAQAQPHTRIGAQRQQGIGPQAYGNIPQNGVHAPVQPVVATFPSVPEVNPQLPGPVPNMVGTFEIGGARLSTPVRGPASMMPAPVMIPSERRDSSQTPASLAGPRPVTPTPADRPVPATPLSPHNRQAPTSGVVGSAGSRRSRSDSTEVALQAPKRARVSDAQNIPPNPESPVVQPLSGDAATASGPASVESKAGTTWTDAENNAFFFQLFDPDGLCKGKLGDAKQASTIAWKKMLPFVPGRSESACRSHFDTCRKIYKNINAIESITGGGGDADAPLTFDDRHAKAKRSGKLTEELKKSTYDKWMQQGWYQKWHDAFSEHKGVKRTREFHSGDLSDREASLANRADSDGASDNSDIEEIASPATAASNAAAVKAQGTVSTKVANRSQVPGVPVPAHQPRSRKGQAASILADLIDVGAKQLELTAKNSTFFQTYLQNKEKREDSKVAQEERRERLKIAQEIVKDPAYPEEIRAQAKQVILEYMTL